MRMGLRLVVVSCVVIWLTSSARSQEPPKPGPEHELLKQTEGTWDATVKMRDQESKATATYKMDVGGLWLVSKFEGEIFGGKFQGRGLESYDPKKKKYVSVWVDSLSTTPMIMEGTYDKEAKTFTMTSEATGPDGKPVIYKSVTEHKDPDTMVFNLSMAEKGGKDQPMLTITYKRKK